MCVVCVCVCVCVRVCVKGGNLFIICSLLFSLGSVQMVIVLYLPVLQKEGGGCMCSLSVHNVCVCVCVCVGVCVCVCVCVCFSFSSWSGLNLLSYSV